MREEFIHFPQTERNTHFVIELAGISYCDETYKIRRTRSNCMVVEYIIAGRGTVILDGRKYEAGAGDIYMLPPGRDHFYYSDKYEPWEKIWVNARGSLIAPLLWEYNPGNMVLFKNAGGRKYIERIHEVGRNTEYSAVEKNQRAALIFHEFLQYLYDGFYGEESMISESAGRMKEYLDIHISKNVSLKELAELVFLSESQVVRCFKRDMGVTPHEYSLHLKLEEAKKMLKNTGYMVREIAEYLGFCDEHYFSYVFKKKIGKTPLEYRNSCF